MSILMVSDDGTMGVIVDTDGSGSVVAETSFFSIVGAARLPDGTFCTSTSNVLAPLRIFTYTAPSTFTEVAQFDGGTQVNATVQLNVVGDNFWGLLNENVAHASFYKFNAAGVVSNTVGPVTTVATTAVFCVDELETIAYYVDSLNNDIKRWDLVNNIGLTNLVSGFNSNWICDGLYKVPGSTDIVAIMNNAGGAGDNTRLIVRYNASGGTVYSVTFLTIPSPSEDNFEETAISYDLASIWTRNAGAPSWDITVDCLYTKVAIADGSTLESVTIPVTATPAPGSTCFLLDLTTVSTTGTEGLYIIVDRTNDKYFVTDSTFEETAIPEPSATLFPQGD